MTYALGALTNLSALCYPILSRVVQLNKHGNTEPMAETSAFLLQALGVAKGSNHQLVFTTASCRHGTGIVEPLQYLVGSLPSFGSF